MNKFKPIELTKENVDAIFQYCLANEYDDASDIYNAHLFLDRTDINGINFSKSRLEKSKKQIMYLIGQMKVVHDTHPMRTYCVDELKYTYRNEIWNNTSYRSLALPHLTRYFEWCSPLFLVDDKYYLHTTNVDFKMTLSPSDPRFEDWWKHHKIEWMD